jgi:hypothetical protein
VVWQLASSLDLKELLMALFMGLGLGPTRIGRMKLSYINNLRKVCLMGFPWIAARLNLKALANRCWRIVNR